LIKKIIVSASESNFRIDKLLKMNFSTLTQSFIEKNIRKKNIIVNNEVVTSKYRLKTNDEIKILNFNKDSYKHNPKIKKKYIIPKNIKALFNESIIYNDNNFFIINKWSGISTQGGSKINISIDHIIKDMSNSYNLVHRLDKETSGILIVAKNLEYTKLFGHMFKQSLIEKKYLAFCQGKPRLPESIVNLDISLNCNKDKNAKTFTYYKLLNYKSGISQILFTPKTGKKHQLRIVSKNLGCPIIGDKKYNSNNRFDKEKLKLNAIGIKFKIKSKEYIFKSIIPKDFINFIKYNKLNKFDKLNF